MSLKSLIPKDADFEPKTLGEHLKKRRVELGLFQKQAAQKLDISKWTYLGWELNRKSPVIVLWPRIIHFLGYDPNPEPVTLCQRLISKRRRLGLSLEKAAKLIGIDEGTLRNWESGERMPDLIRQKWIKVLLASSRKMEN